MNKKFQNLLIKTLGLILLQGMLIITTAYSADTEEDIFKQRSIAIDRGQNILVEELKDMSILEEFFIKIVNKAIDDYQTTDNKAKKTKIIFDLSRSLSDLFKDRTPTDWVGMITSIDTDQYDASAMITVVLSVKIPPKKNYTSGIILKTTNKDFGKYRINTGIPIGTNLYNTVSELKRGDIVVFSGRFVSLSNGNTLFTMGDIDDFLFWIFNASFPFEFTSIKKQK